MKSIVGLGDSLELLSNLPKGSMDMVLTRIPQDLVIKNELDLNRFWQEIVRVTSHNACIAIVSRPPCSYKLVEASVVPYRYEWVMEDESKGSTASIKRSRPSRVHEDVYIFYRRKPVYNLNTAQPKDVVGFMENSRTGPLLAFEYLIETYTDKGMTVLDPFMNDGLTGLACKRTDRNFIGFEKDNKVLFTASERVARGCKTKAPKGYLRYDMY